MRYSFVSLTGPVRRENQDALMLERIGPNFFSLVCDGMGGHWGGGFASEIATEGFKEIIRGEYQAQLLKNTILEDEVLSLSIVRNSIKHILNKMRQFAGNDRQKQRMGTTFSLLILNPTIEKAMVVNIGDSRCYSLDDDRSLKQLLPDQNLHNYLLRLNYTPEQIQREAQQNLRALTSCLSPSFGFEKNLEIDYRFLSLSGISYLFQATDGLYDFLTEDQLKSIVTSDLSIKLKLEGLIQTALKNSSNDNLTGILIKL